MKWALAAAAVIGMALIGQCAMADRPEPAWWCDNDAYRQALIEERGLWEATKYTADNC